MFICFFAFSFSSRVLGIMLEVSLELTLPSLPGNLTPFFSIILNGIDLDLGRVYYW